MKLYIYPISSNCRIVQAVVANLGLDVEVVTVNLPEGETRTPEYLAINPNGKVPALVDGNLKIWESSAIMQYLADKKPGNTLYPKDPDMRLDIHRWQFWGVAHYLPAAFSLGWERYVKPVMLKQETDQARVEKSLEEFHRFAAVLNGQLEDRSFVTGELPTLADLQLGGTAPSIEYGNIPVDDYPYLKAWYARLDSIPGWTDTAPPQPRHGAA